MNYRVSMIIGPGLAVGAHNGGYITVNGLWVRFPLEEMKIFKMITILFLCSGNEAKRGLEFRHSTRNASRV